MKHSARILMLLLAISLLMAPMGGLAQEAAQGDGALVVGSTSALTGEFYLDLWGNNTSDLDVRYFIQGYRTIVGQETADRRPNPLSVAGMDVTEKGGSKTFTFRLQPNMVYSDGTDITAKDYVLTLLLTYHPLMREVGATVEPLTQIVGGKDYQAMKTPALKGVRLIDERTFSVTLAANALPDYNELRYVDITPSPLHVLLPDTDIVDNGKGAEFSKELKAEDLKAVLTGENSYRSHPTVCSGPYVLESYDEEQHIANLVRNEKYTGPKPAIERIRLVPVANEDIAEALKSGRVHLMNKVSYGKALRDLGMATGLNKQSYPRQGMAYLGFAFESKAVSNLKVRQAVAHSINRTAIISDFLGGNGQVVNGYYGMGQWMAQTYAKVGKEEIKGYEYNLDEAAKLLKQAGYSEKNPLKLTLLIAEGSMAGEAVAEQLKTSFEKLGAELVVDRKPWQQTLEQFYRQSPRAYDMIFMASNFDPYFEPSLQFAVEKEYQGARNQMGVANNALYNAAKAMRSTQSDKPDLYYTRWVAFQQEFVKALPLIPLYSNTYTDVFTDRLVGYDITAHMSCAYALLNASFSAE